MRDGNNVGSGEYPVTTTSDLDLFIRTKVGFAGINNPLMIIVAVEEAMIKNDVKDTHSLINDKEAPRDAPMETPMEAPKKMQH